MKFRTVSWGNGPRDCRQGASRAGDHPASRTARIADFTSLPPLLRASPATHHSETSPHFAEKFREKTLLGRQGLRGFRGLRGLRSRLGLWVRRTLWGLRGRRSLRGEELHGLQGLLEDRPGIPGVGVPSEG